jgi:hypothetical protein
MEFYSIRIVLYFARANFNLASAVSEMLDDDYLSVPDWLGKCLDLYCRQNGAFGDTTRIEASAPDDVEHLRLGGI